MSDLPLGWTWVTLNDLQADEPRAITDGPFGSNLTSAHYSDSGARVIRLQNIGDGKFIDVEAYVPLAHFETLRSHEACAGDLIVASLGEVLPKACIVPANLGPAIVKADCIRVRLGRRVDPRWALYAMQTPSVRRWASEQLHGVGRPRLGLKVIRQLPIPLPPIEEQQRIVDILEDHLSRLDAAQRDLDGSQKKLATLEHAVLARGYQGGPHVPLGDVTRIQGGIQKQQKRAPRLNPHPFLRVANVTSRGLDLAEVHSVELFPGELEKLRLQSGDLLVVEGNGSATQIGRAALWDGSINDCVHQNHLIRVRANEGLLPGFLEALWNSPVHRAQLTTLASSSSGLYTLSVSKLKSMTIPLPDVARQRAVLDQVVEARQARQRLDGGIATATARATQLRRSLMQAAFTGRLTQTDISQGIEAMADV